MSAKNGTRVMEKHKSLYFMDGNVVILAPQEKPGLGVLFRVHRSVLSSHSPIFSDMFDVCNPSSSTSLEGEADHSYDGVPLVHLSDNSDHLGSVLEVLYYQSDLPWMPRSPHYPALITPILDLARKYGVDRMYTQIIKHLECDWPRTLKDWDKLERDIQFALDNLEIERIDDHFPEPAAAIKLAHQFDIPNILPAAFYHLSRLSILDDWEKTHADPSISIRNPTKRTARWELLSAQDFRCLLFGRAELVEFLRGSKDAKDLRHASVSYTTSRRETCTAGEKLWTEIVNRCLQSVDPLKALQTEEIVVRAQQCQTCAKKIQDKIRDIRAQIWEGLGSLFHLDAAERVVSYRKPDASACGQLTTGGAGFDYESE